jgi:four helix bundle protein
MNEIRNHRDLEAWRLAMDVVMETYDVTECFPAKEIYGLQSQMRRAAVSVPSNIAEGQARPLRASLNHLSIALGSLAELDTQLEIANRRQYIPEAAEARFRTVHNSTRRLVFGLRRAKRRRLASDVVGCAGLVLLAVYTMSHLLA